MIVAACCDIEMILMLAERVRSGNRVLAYVRAVEHGADCGRSQQGHSNTPIHGEYPE
jgi:hypothetical protein